MVRADTGVLLTAADRVHAAAAALRAIDATTPFVDVSAALPGSQVSQSCLWVSTRLGAALQVWADRLEDVSGATSGTASDLVATDRAVGDGLRGATPR